MDDLCLIDKVIGLKIALSDHRSAHPTVDELRRAVSEARVGGMLTGKALGFPLARRQASICFMLSRWRRSEAMKRPRIVYMVEMFSMFL